MKKQKIPTKKNKNDKKIFGNVIFLMAIICN